MPSTIVMATVVGALLIGLPLQALALDQDSTMAEWSQAGDAEKRALIETLGPRLTPSFRSEEGDILACLDLAARSSAHANLPVSEIAKACAEAAEPEKPGQSNDI